MPTNEESKQYLCNLSCKHGSCSYELNPGHLHHKGVILSFHHYYLRTYWSIIKFANYLMKLEISQLGFSLWMIPGPWLCFSFSLYFFVYFLSDTCCCLILLMLYVTNCLFHCIKTNFLPWIATFFWLCHLFKHLQW